MFSYARMLFTLLSSFALTAHALSPGSACSCSSGFIPIPVDVTIPVDPSKPEGLNSTDKFRLRRTFDVFGVLCEPVPTDSKYTHAVQMLLHGQTYTADYWDVHLGQFRNYSYVAHSCRQGISSFAYDNVGAGRTTRPVNSSDCQIPVAASVASSLARGLKSGTVSNILTGNAKKFQKVVPMGHSLGSATLNYAIIIDGKSSDFDGLLLTGSVHDKQFIIKSPVVALPAAVVDPVRWPNLDPGYITTPNASARDLFYGPDETSFSHTLFQLDELTKDTGSRWISAQIKFIYTPAHGFKGPVVELVGSLDQTHCLPNGQPCNQAELQVSEAVYFPDSKRFTMVVLDGYGHDVNFEFCAARAFSYMTDFFKHTVT